MMRQFYRTLCFLIFIVFPFGQLAKVPVRMFGLVEVNFYLLDILVGLLVFVNLIEMIIVKKQINFKFFLPVIPFVLVALLSLFLTPLSLNWSQMTVSSLYLVRWLVYSLLIIVLVNLNKFDKDQFSRDNLNCFLGIAGTSLVLFGLAQYLLWPDLTALNWWQWDPHLNRLIGTFLDPNFTGIILVLTIISLIINNFEYLGRIKRYWFLHLQLVVVLVGLALTYSRSSYLALFIGLIMIAGLKKSGKIIFLLIGIVITVYLLLPIDTGGEGVRLTRTSTINSRFTNWQQAIKIGADNPIIGIGFNTYRYAQAKYGFITDDWQEIHSGGGADNSWLFVFATTGIAGLLAYLFFWVKLLGVKRVIGDNRVDDRKNLILISYTAVAIHSLFINSLFYPWVMFWLAVVVSVTIIQRN